MAALKGSKTEENLKAAFAGESQANRRYALWARIAELEGAAAAVEAFELAAAEETAHALGQLAYMGGFGTTAENLAAASEGEAFEWREMYPRMAEEAEAEGYPEVAHFFRSVGGFEGKHDRTYKEALDTL